MNGQRTDMERKALLTLATLPRWLNETPLAVLLREDKTDADDGSFEVPEAYYLTDEEVANTTTAIGLEKVLRVLHYWGERDKFPWAVLDLARELKLVEPMCWKELGENMPDMEIGIRALEIIWTQGFTLNCTHELVKWGIYGDCGMPMNMAVLGIQKLVKVQLAMVNWDVCAMPMKTDVLGMKELVPVQPQMATWSVCAICMKMNVLGMSALVKMQLDTATWNVCSMRMNTAVLGVYTLVPGQPFPCAIVIWNVCDMPLKTVVRAQNTTVN